MKMKIGADELILWIRKNDIAKAISNDGSYGLGFEICRIIEGLGGVKIEDNVDCYWAIPVGNSIIDKYNLPKKAAQYEINTDILPAIYEKLSQL